MAYRNVLFALSIIALASPAAAFQPEATPPPEGAPPAPPGARYCLKVDPLPGSLMETVRCKTRDEWAMLDVDVDQEWPTEGVKVIVPTAPNS